MGTPHAFALGGRSRVTARDGGFTLLELLIVMTLIGILTGIGVGFLRRKGDDLALAVAIVRDQARVAALTARSRHLPTEVEFDAGQDGPATARARVLEPVGSWHMEADIRGDDTAGLPSEVGGEAEPGRFGMARRVDPSLRRGLLRVDFGNRSVADLHDGFAMRLDVKLDIADAATLFRLGSSLELRLDEALLPIAKMVGTEGGGRTGPQATLRGRTPLSVGRWHTVQLVHDGRELRLLVDDREVDRVAATLPVLQVAGDAFEVSPADSPVSGLVDEVVVMAYSFADAQSLPPGIQLAARPAVARFDRNGDLVEPVEFRLVDGEDERTYRIGPGGIVE